MFKQKRDVPTVEGFGPFLGSIYPWNIAKIQNFPWDYECHKYQVPDKSQNSYKTNQIYKNFLR